MAIIKTDFEKIWASTSPLTPYNFSESNYKEGWNFIGATPPARQMWDFLQKNNDEKMKFLLDYTDTKVPLSIGSSTIPTYTNANGVVTASNASVGSTKKPVYMDSGEIKAISDTVGDANTPVYLNAGEITSTGKSFSNYLPLAGGTMTGHIICSYAGEYQIRKNADAGNIIIMGGSGWNKGAYVSLMGKDKITQAGEFLCVAHDGTNGKTLEGKPDGTLVWNGQVVQTSSDKRLKQDFSDIPNDVLEAWGEVNWTQFKYKEDAERKGAENCRWHVGLVAQDVKEVGEENDVDLLKYGILCHDEWGKDDDHEEAGDMWTIRYTEALCMEVAYLRKKIAELEARLGAE